MLLDVFFLIFKILFTAFYMTTVLIYPFLDKRVWSMLVPMNIRRYLDISNLFSAWNLFNHNKDTYYTIIIKVKTNKKEYSWNLRADKKIGDIALHSNHHRLTFAHYYPYTGHLFANQYYFENIKKYLEKNGEELLSYSMSIRTFDSRSRTMLPQKDVEPFFSWGKEHDKSS